ncbi:MAG: hypothetical protein ABSE73_32055 [Planctomycetota bacterium]
MASFKTRDFEHALKQKGFAEDRTHHRMFWLFVEGKRTSVHTYTSQGERDFGDSLMNQRRKQMGGLSRKQMQDFIECPFSHKDYIDVLEKAGRTKLQPRNEAGNSGARG